MWRKLGATVLALLLGASTLSAQTSSLEGKWEGTFGRSRLRLVLDITKTLDGQFAVYAHLMPKSVQVKPGDRVRRGQVIGRLGNSGYSSGPHLHFHVGDRSDALESEGLPCVIDSWELVRAAGTLARRRNEIPLYNARVRFPQN